MAARRVVRSDNRNSDAAMKEIYSVDSCANMRFLLLPPSLLSVGWCSNLSVGSINLVFNFQLLMDKYPTYDSLSKTN